MMRHIERERARGPRRASEEHLHHLLLPLAHSPPRPLFPAPPRRHLRPQRLRGSLALPSGRRPVEERARPLPLAPSPPLPLLRRVIPSPLAPQRPGSLSATNRGSGAYCTTRPLG